MNTIVIVTGFKITPRYFNKIFKHKQNIHELIQISSAIQAAVCIRWHGGQAIITRSIEEILHKSGEGQLKNSKAKAMTSSVVVSYYRLTCFTNRQKQAKTSTRRAADSMSRGNPYNVRLEPECVPLLTLTLEKVWRTLTKGHLLSHPEMVLEQVPLHEWGGGGGGGGGGEWSSTANWVTFAQQTCSSPTSPRPEPTATLVSHCNLSRVGSFITASERDRAVNNVWVGKGCSVTRVSLLL